MRLNIRYSFAVLLGLAASSHAWAEYGQGPQGAYVPPAKWSQFNSGLAQTPPLTPLPKQTLVRPVSGDTLLESGLTDGYTVAPPAPIPQYAPPEHSDVPPPSSSAFQEALCAPADCDPAPTLCIPARRPLFPWLAGGSLLLWNFNDNQYQRFLARDGAPAVTMANTDDVAPGFTTGYDVFVGRYLGCGEHALLLNYLNFNPEMEQRIVTGGNYATMPHWDEISIDRDGGGPDPAETVADIYDAAAVHRVTRNVNVQGLELNFASFGVIGGRRLAPACGTGLGGGRFGLGNLFGCGTRYGLTGAGGPLSQPQCGAAQIVTTHGFRWFQFEDQFELASSDLADGYDDPDDMFYRSDVSNDLYGYQFGARMIYCLAPRLTANLGGKAGIYGNDVSVTQRLGTFGDTAFVNSMPGDRIDTTDRDCVLAGLGELDLGLGYRISNGWTLNGGYRMLYATGVATSIGSIADEYYTLAPSARAAASDNILLHGAYVGAAFNW